MSEFRRRLLAKKDDGELKENEILAIYDVTITGSAIRLLGNSFNLSYVAKMKIDGVEVTPTKTHKFNEIGEIPVIITIKPGVIELTNMFNSSVLKFVDMSKIQENIIYTNSMFEVCNKLTTISVFDTRNVIGMNRLFMNCSSLTTVPLLDAISVTDIYNMFFNCTSLQNFEGLKNLSSVDLSLSSSNKLTPLSIHNIIEQALGNFTLTLNATAKANWQNSEYFYEDYLMLKEKNITIANLTITTINIPEGVTTIPDNAFSELTSLTSVTIPEGVNTIGNNAFANCTSLTSITVPSTVTYIGDNAFSGCVNISTIEMNPTTAPTLGENVWGNNESNYIGSNVSVDKYVNIKDEYIGYDTDKWNVLVDLGFDFIRSYELINAIGANGNDYLVLDYKPNRNTIIRVEYKHFNTIGGSEPFIDAGDWANATSTTNRFAVVAGDKFNKGLFVAIGDIIGTSPLINNDVNKKTFFNIDMNTFTITTALGTTDLSKNLNVTGFTSSDFLHIFKRNDTNKIAPNNCIFVYRIFVIENNTPIAEYLPFKDDRGNGLINVMNNTKFYGAKGTKFIEEL